MWKKLTIIALCALFGFGYYSAGASSAIAVETAEIEYVENHAQSFTVAADAEVTSAVRDEFVVEMKTVVRYPVDNLVVSSGFGWRSSPCRSCSSNHMGIDYTPGYGTPVYAIAPGEVIASGWSGSFGQMVTIRHTINGVQVDSLYAHMKAGSLPYGVGDTVKIGDVIGAVGNTGTSTGAHLHFEIHVDGVVINPGPWLANNVNINAWNHLS